MVRDTLLSMWICLINKFNPTRSFHQIWPTDWTLVSGNAEMLNKHNLRRTETRISKDMTGSCERSIPRLGSSINIIIEICLIVINLN
jgi:hypothetical protein